MPAEHHRKQRAAKHLPPTALVVAINAASAAIHSANVVVTIVGGRRLSVTPSLSPQSPICDGLASHATKHGGHLQPDADRVVAVRDGLVPGVNTRRAHDSSSGASVTTVEITMPNKPASPVPASATPFLLAVRIDVPVADGNLTSLTDVSVSIVGAASAIVAFDDERFGPNARIGNCFEPVLGAVSVSISHVNPHVHLPYCHDRFQHRSMSLPTSAVDTAVIHTRRVSCIQAPAGLSAQSLAIHAIAARIDLGHINITGKIAISTISAPIAINAITTTSVSPTSITSTSGDIRVAGPIQAFLSNIDISTSTGDIVLNAVRARTVSITSQSGSIALSAPVVSALSPPQFITSGSLINTTHCRHHPLGHLHHKSPLTHLKSQSQSTLLTHSSRKNSPILLNTCSNDDLRITSPHRQRFAYAHASQSSLVAVDAGVMAAAAALRSASSTFATSSKL